MNAPLISIITPTYNHKFYVKECIESVLNQTYLNWEMIIVDDFSNDGTSEIIEEYIKKDKRVRTIRHIDNYGIYRLSESYNEALKIAHGEFIAILEGDDYWPKDKLKKQIKLFFDSNIILTWGSAKYVDEKNNILGMCSQPWKKWPRNIVWHKLRSYSLKILLLGFSPSPAVTIMIRRKSLLEIGGFWQPDGVFYVDYSTCLKLSLIGNFFYSKDILGYWRIHKNQISSTLAHSSTSTATEIFWKKLSIEEKKKYGIEDMGKLIETKLWYVRGCRAMANGKIKQARQFFIKVIIKGRGLLFCFKAGILLIASFFIPSLVQSKLASPLNFSVWFKKNIFKL